MTNTTTFATFLIEQRQGSLHSELSELMQTLVREVKETGKGGTLTVKIEVKQAENGLNLLVTDDVSLKLPKPNRGAAFWFSDEEGNVSRRDPYQQEIPGLRELPAKEASNE